MRMLRTPPAPTADPPEAVRDYTYSQRQLTLIMSGLMLGVLLSALDQTIVTTALTTISRDFKRPDLYGWVVTSYLLTSTVTTPLYGKISDLFGRKRIFQFAIVLFLVGSALSGLSGNMYQLIVFRGVQGLGAGGLMSVALAIVGSVVAPRDRGRYLSLFGAVFAVASVVGPLVGGFLVEQATWRWVFYVNLPIGVFALVVIDRVLKLDHQPSRPRIDFAGAVLVVSGVALFLVGVQTAGTHATITTSAFVFGAAGLLLVAAFLWWETKATEPVLPLRLFSSRVLSVTVMLSLITGVVMFGVVLFSAQYLQSVRGVSPTSSGLRLVPLLGGVVVCAIGSGLAMSATGRYKILVVVGTAILTGGTALLTQVHVHTSLVGLSLILFIVGAGLGLFMQTLVTVAQNAVDRADLGVATSSVAFFRTLGGAIGASVFGAILVNQERAALGRDVARYGLATGRLFAFTHGMDHAYLYATVVALLAFVLSLLLREVRLRTGEDPPDERSAVVAATLSATARTR